MVRRTPEQVFAALLAAGWPPELAVTMTAIAGAESGWDSDALGDVALADATWGPSYGLFQIRTLKGATGTGSPRDVARLAASDVEQARAAWEISQGGRDFTPWSVYSTGAYQAYLGAAQAAAERVTGADRHWPSVVGNRMLSGARHVALEAAWIAAGLALAGVGAWLLVRGARRAGR